MVSHRRALSLALGLVFAGCGDSSPPASTGNTTSGAAGAGGASAGDGGAAGAGAAAGSGGAGGLGDGGMAGSGGATGTGGMTGSTSTGPCEGPPPSGKPPIAAPAEQWTWVGVEGAFCANGTGTGLGINPTSKSNRVLVYLLGGGACWSKETCYDQPLAAFIDSGFGGEDFEGLGVQGFPFFDRGNPNNPFADYSYVVVPYCTGDIHAGNNIADHGGKKTAHVGYANMGAYLARLTATFPKAERVVLAGGSAGGYGASLNWGQAQDAFGCVRVDMIDDVGPLLPPPYLSEELEQKWRAAWNLAATLPADCAACADDLHAVYAHTAAKHPGSRGALLASMFDSVISFYFGLSQAQLAEGLLSLASGSLDGVPNFRYFYLAKDQHGMFAPGVEQSGVVMEDWLVQMLADDPAWPNVKPGCDDAGDCGTCRICAANGPCAAEWSACQANPDCTNLLACVNACDGKQQCVDTCILAYQNGFAAAAAALDCVDCKTCVDTCGGC